MVFLGVINEPKADHQESLFREIFSGFPQDVTFFPEPGVFSFELPDPLGFVHLGWRGFFSGSRGAVFFHPVRQRGAVDPEISGDGLDRGARGVLIQGDGVALELL